MKFLCLSQSSLHAFKDSIHYAKVLTFKINALKYYDLINSHVVFCVLHTSSVSEPDSRKWSYRITCIGKLLWNAISLSEES